MKKSVQENLAGKLYGSKNSRLYFVFPVLVRGVLVIKRTIIN